MDTDVKISLLFVTCVAHNYLQQHTPEAGASPSNKLKEEEDSPYPCPKGI